MLQYLKQCNYIFIVNIWQPQLSLFTMYLTGYVYSVYNQYTEIIVSLFAYSCHIGTYMHCKYLT